MERNTEIIVPRSEDFREMDARDEKQMLLALRGSFLKEFVYKFPQGGREVVGISWSGIKEIAYRVQGIDTEIESQSETDEAYTFIVKATNKNINSSRLGVGYQSKLMKRGGNMVLDQFAIQKALSKAQRNAIRGVIPEATIKTYIELFSDEGRVDTQAPASRKAVTSEAKTKPKTKPKAKKKATNNSKDIEGQVQMMRDYGEAERVEDDNYRWSAEDTGIEDVATPLPQPFVDLLVGKVGEPLADLLKMGMYQNTPVIVTQKKLTNKDWDTVNAAFYDYGVRWCSAVKSSHWFALPSGTPD